MKMTPKQRQATGKSPISKGVPGFLDGGFLVKAPPWLDAVLAAVGVTTAGVGAAGVKAFKREPAGALDTWTGSSGASNIR
jgi:hypothetical protein